jgi:hypothetical protein
MFRLPLSGESVNVRSMSGEEEILLREANGFDRLLALDLVRRLLPTRAAEDLAVYDFEAVLLYVRGRIFGNLVNAHARCHCGGEVGLAFHIDEYLAHHAPRMQKDVVRGAEPGWFSVARRGVEFRLPTIEDQIVVGRAPDPLQALSERCVRPAHAWRRVDRVMARMAPALSDAIEGVCPHCTASIALLFDVPTFVTHELAVQASLIYEDVHLLASRYHWREEYILALPCGRRQRYAELLRAEAS